MQGIQLAAINSVRAGATHGTCCQTSDLIGCAIGYHRTYRGFVERRGHAGGDADLVVRLCGHNVVARFNRQGFT